MPETNPNQSSGAAAQPVPVDSIVIDTTFVTKPLVVFFGPASSGKTITLLSLAKHIGTDLTVVEEGFRRDPGYRTTIQEFENARGQSDIEPGSTGKVDFLLLKWSQDSNPFCYLLEAPGEHYFDPARPNYAPMYLKKIFSASYRKVFVLFFEDAITSNEQMLEGYCGKIRSTLSLVEAKNAHVIVLYNKCDMDRSIWRDGKPIKKQFHNKLFGIKIPAVKELEKFLSSRFKSYDFVPYQSGDFTQVMGTPRMQFLEKPDFANSLKEAIRSGVRGRSLLGGLFK